MKSWVSSRFICGILWVVSALGLGEEELDDKGAWFDGGVSFVEGGLKRS